MKKIFNWTFGSIFRTFGRIIAYLSVGLLIASILSKTGFKLTDLLPIMKVNASEISSNVSYLDEEYFTITSNNTFYNSLDYYVFTLTGDNSSHRIQVNLDNPINTSNFDYIQLNYIASGGFSTNNNTNTNNLNYNYCKVWTKSSQNDSYICTQFKEDTDEFIIQNDTISYYNLSNFINVYAVANDYSRLNCSVNGNNILCPTNNKTITQFTFDYAFNGNNSQVKFYFYGRYSKFTSDNNKINNSINNINDSINNDNVDDSSNAASNFFNNFSTDTHGLTGIITAPLNAIQSLTSKTCSPLVLPLPFVDKDLTLPCMREIYVDNFGAFMNIYDIITLGIISYWVMVRIFALVKDFKNPDHDEIEVMDL